MDSGPVGLSLTTDEFFQVPGSSSSLQRHPHRYSWANNISTYYTSSFESHPRQTSSSQPSLTSKPSILRRQTLPAVYVPRTSSIPDVERIDGSPTKPIPNFSRRLPGRASIEEMDSTAWPCKSSVLANSQRSKIKRWDGINRTFSAWDGLRKVSSAYRLSS